jgi:hypothetical protein
MLHLGLLTRYLILLGNCWRITEYGLVEAQHYGVVFTDT